jgi:hypothetical protein
MYSASEIQFQFEEMQNARVSLYNHAEKEMLARETLKKAEAEAQLSGKCDGKNAEVRQAQLREITALPLEALAMAETEKRNAALRFELSSMRVDCIKWIIRATQSQ